MLCGKNFWNDTLGIMTKIVLIMDLGHLCMFLVTTISMVLPKPIIHIVIPKRIKQPKHKGTIFPADPLTGNF